MSYGRGNTRRPPPFGWLKCYLCHDGNVSNYYVLGTIKEGRRTYGICKTCHYNYNQKIK